MKKILIILLALATVVSLASCNKCKDHVDKDDDYLCDNCGENFDDGDEEPEIPEQTGHSVTFVTLLDDGTPVSGVKIYIVRGELTIELVSGQDGKVSATLDNLAYSIEYDYDTLPEYCTPDVFGVKITAETKTVELKIYNNQPDGSEEKPFHIMENETPITLSAGQKLYYSFHGSTMRFLTVDREGITVNYDGSSYSLSAGTLPLCIEPEIGSTVLFSVENTTSSELTFTLSLTSMPGSNENPYELLGNGASALVSSEKIVFYTWTADKDGVLTLTSESDRNNISVTKHLENDVVIVEQTNGENTLTMEVLAGDVITFGISALSAGDGEPEEIEISFTISVN